jgi:hypothetical protein
MIGWTILLTWFLWVILIGVPTSTEESTFLSQLTTFPTVLPSVLKVNWYPTCILEFHFWNRKSTTQVDSLYPTFVVYLTTIYGRLSFLRISSPRRDTFTWWIIQSFKEHIGRFRFCFTKLRRTFQFVKFFSNFFYGYYNWCGNMFHLHFKCEGVP